MANCKDCVMFKTCKFVEKQIEMSKTMYRMFEYAEQNNLNEIFYSNAGSCKYFIFNEFNIQSLLSKIKTAKYQMKWINDYLKNTNKRLKDSFIVEQLLKITEDYKTKLEL